MRSGRLKHKGKIEVKVKTQDAAGGATETWQKHADVWFGIKPLNGNEKYVSHEKYATATHEITIRYVPGVKPDMRLVWGVRIFEINSALNIKEENKMLQLIVEEDV